MNEESTNNLRAILSTSGRIDISSSETHRQSALSNLQNALENMSDDDEEIQIRLRRLTTLLIDAEQSTPERKFFLLTYTIFPVLENILD